MKRLFITIFAALAIAVACFAKAEPATITLNVTPAIASQDAANELRTAIRFERGVSEVTAEVGSNDIVIVYDPAKISPDLLAEALKQLGYQVAEPASNDKK
ncbi:MAG: heavy-metal-associated domain-containing protein [Muribaculaceae bacterium]